jgi:hypothetical protein
MPALKKSKIGSREAGPRGKSVHLVNEGRPARSRLARKRPPTRDTSEDDHFGAAYQSKRPPGTGRAHISEQLALGCR